MINKDQLKIEKSLQKIKNSMKDMVEMLHLWLSKRCLSGVLGSEDPFNRISVYLSRVSDGNRGKLMSTCNTLDFGVDLGAHSYP